MKIKALLFTTFCGALFAQSPDALPTPGFHHLHLNSTNPEAAIQFYTTQFKTARPKTLLTVSRRSKPGRSGCCSIKSQRLPRSRRRPPSGTGVGMCPTSEPTWRTITKFTRRFCRYGRVRAIILSRSVPTAGRARAVLWGVRKPRSKKLSRRASNRLAALVSPIWPAPMAP